VVELDVDQFPAGPVLARGQALLCGTGEIVEVPIAHVFDASRGETADECGADQRLHGLSSDATASKLNVNPMLPRTSHSFSSSVRFDQLMDSGSLTPELLMGSVRRS